jgi:lipid-A-disaccharide synthase
MSGGARITIVAGEASGDLYGALLGRALRELEPSLSLSGIGGTRMREEGIPLEADSRELAVVGLVEVLSHWKPIRAAYRRMMARLRNDPPELLILIDYPDFNLRLAEEAHRRNIPVVYFISPQVWAWRRSRVRKIARTVNRMLVVLPFEEEIYRRAGVPVEFVGHPLLDLLPANWDRERGRRNFGLLPGTPVVGLLPGSRRREIGFHLPVMLAAAEELRKRVGGFQTVIPLASSLDADDLLPHLRRAEATLGKIHLLRGGPGEALGTMDAAVVKSGTATLEAGLMGVPMVVVYRTTPLTYLLASLLANVRHVGLVNIVAGKALVPELVQSECTSDKIAAALEPFLRDPALAEALRRDMAGLKARLGTPGCFSRAAAAALDVLRNSDVSARRASSC